MGDRSVVLRYLTIIFFALTYAQNPVSDQGMDIVTEPGMLVEISGSNSYAVGENSIASYTWTVPQEILDANPGLNLNSENLSFTAPDVSSTTVYSITLEVLDSAGNVSQEFDSSHLIISEYCESGSSNDRYIEIFNGTGATITQEDWQDYEIWIARDNAEFMDPEQRFWVKLLFFRSATEEDADHDMDLDDITTKNPPDLEHGQTLVIAKSLTNGDPLITSSDIIIEWGDLSRMAGNDGVALVKDGVPVDVIGSGDEGDEWNVAGESEATKDFTLVRKSNVVLGNYPNWDDSAGTNIDDSEWTVFEEDTFDYAGSHSCTACDNEIVLTVAIAPVANAGEDFSTCSESFSLTGSGDQEGLAYVYDWELTTGSCSDDNYIREIDCTNAGYIWTSYDWYTNECGNPNNLTSDSCNEIYCVWSDESSSCSDRLTNFDASSASFLSPTTLDNNQQFCFSLVVNDGFVQSSPDAVCVDIASNLCPIADAGEDRVYRLNTMDTVVLYGDSSYDPNSGDALTFLWEQVSGQDVDIADETSSALSLSNFPSVLDSNPSEFKFALTVNDGTSDSEISDTVKITMADFAAPDSPNLYAVAYSDYVKLSWDFVSESSIDPLTNYADFEGYKLYRSEDGGQTWCAPDKKIYDFNGNEVACEPLAQFDLTEAQDIAHCIFKEGYTDCEQTRGEDISQYDPTEGWLYMGSGEGVTHIYIDEDVVDGMEYTYTLTAYDMGVRTYSLDYVFLESSDSVGEDYTDTNDNGLYDDGETFIDSNGNGEWDGSPIYAQETNWSSSNPDHWTSQGRSEAFVDDNEDGLYTDGESYTDDNGNGQWDSVLSTEEGVSYSLAYMESPLGQEGDGNFVKAIPGALPVNVTDPLPEQSDNFIVADENNVGNAERYFDIVDKSLIENKKIKFEIQAEYGTNESGNIINSFEGNKSENPTLYAWEVDANGNAVSPIEYQITSDMTYTDMEQLQGYGLPGWELSVDWLDVISAVLDAGVDISNIEDDPTQEQQEILMSVLVDLGASFYSPIYLVDGMPVTFSDELGAEENWTDLVYGVRFKFDNGFLHYESTKDGAEYYPPFRETYSREVDGEGNYDSSDSSLMRNLFIVSDRSTEITYYSQQVFTMRPPYKYKIVFYDEPTSPATDMVAPPQPWNGWSSSGIANSCTSAEGSTKLPFRVYNLTTEEEVQLLHRDYGLNDGYSTDQEGNTAQDYFKDGRKDCFWSRSELVLFSEIVSTYYNETPHIMSTENAGEDNYTYQLNLDYFTFQEYGTDNWDENLNYGEGDRVLFQSTIWEASDVIPQNIKPPSGSDGNGRFGWFDCGDDLKCDQNEPGFSDLNLDPSLDNYNSLSNPTGTEGDGINDNPWKPVYPWKAGDEFYFTPVAWYVDGDNWTIDLSEIGSITEVTDNDLEDVYVVPNPYRAGSSFNSVYNDETIYFRGLPDQCDISIYTVTGKLVDKFSHNNSSTGQYAWHLENSSGEKIAPGLYIYHVESDGNSFAGKFSVVR